VRPSRGALWRHPDFLKLSGGQTVSLVGSQITLLALPVTASLVLGQFLFGLARPVYQVNQVSLRQAITPTRLLGRVNASIYVLSAGTATPGALLGGVLGQRLGFQPTLVMAAIGEALAGLWALLSPLRAVREATPRAAEAPVG
jgi:hypothetical protein